MGSSALELSILNLTSPRKRLGHSCRFSFDNDAAQQHVSGSISPRGKAAVPNSGAAPWFADDDLFTIFEQHQPRAAVPFKWEARPGTRRDEKSFKGAEAAKILRKLSYAESHPSKDAISEDNSLPTSPTFSLSPSGSTNSTTSSSSMSSVSVLNESPGKTSKFMIDPIQIPSTIFTEDDGPGSGRNSVIDSRKLVAEPVISRSGQLVPLKPPPGMHSIKQLLSLETEDRSFAMSCFSTRSVTNSISNNIASNGSAITNLKPHQRRSFRRDGLKALPFVSSAKHQSDDSSTNMLGMEEWAKVVKKQEKQEKQEQREETTEVRGTHHRSLSMPRLPFLSKKKSAAETDSSDTLDVDTVFNDDFGKKGGLRERRPLSSVSSRTFSDVQRLTKAKNWVFDNEVDYSDEETNGTDVFFDTQTIVEEERHLKVRDEDVSVNTIQAAAKEKRKSDALDRLKRIFNLHHKTNDRDHYRISRHKPARLSSVSPAPPPALPPARSEFRLKKATQSKQVSKSVSTSPILKMCSALPFGDAILRNVKQLRSFEFLTPRALTSK